MRRKRPEWLRYSRVKKVVYHATNKDFNFSQFDTGLGDLGAHFGTLEQANYITERRRGGDYSRIIPVWLNLRSPLRLKDIGSFHGDSIGPQLEKKGLIPRGTAKQWRAEVEANYSMRRSINHAARKAILAGGYDSVVYKNAHEGAGDSYCVFRPEQIKSAIGNRGTFDPSDPVITNPRRIKPSNLPSDDDLEQAEARFTDADLFTDAWVTHLDHVYARRDDAIKAIMRHAPFRGLRIPCRYPGTYAIIHPFAKVKTTKPAWQVTMFDDRGPFTDHVFATVEECLRDVHRHNKAMLGQTEIIYNNPRTKRNPMPKHPPKRISLKGTKQLRVMAPMARVYSVDGSVVRSQWADWVGGSHTAVDAFIPKNEIWIERSMGSTEGAFILAHEMIEKLLMDYLHWGYEKAHAAANDLETDLRAFGNTTDKATDIFARYLAKYFRFGQPDAQAKLAAGMARAFMKY